MVYHSILGPLLTAGAGGWPSTAAGTGAGAALASAMHFEGQARTHTDAEDVHHSLTTAGFVIDPPRTERLASGAVAFTLVGKPMLGQGKPAPDGKNAPDVAGVQSASGDSAVTQPAVEPPAVVVPAAEEPAQGGRVP